jgi:drug/metabolite transporter (DMT)-like permease
MIFLILSILSSTSIFLIFKFIDLNKHNSLNVIITNYLTAALVGFILYYKEIPSLLSSFDTYSYLLSATIGILFFVGFILIGKTIESSGLSITSVASKMSVVIPIVFSILYYNEPISLMKIIGVILAMVAIFMLIYKKNNDKKEIAILLPLILFVFMGIIDSFVKFSQTYIFSKDVEFLTYDKNVVLAVFTSLLFLFSFISNLIYYLIRIKYTERFNYKTLSYGLILGLVNFGSIYFLIKALDSDIFKSSIVFGINNTSIVVISILIGLVFFKEKITKLNFAGIIVSIIAISILTSIK